MLYKSLIKKNFKDKKFLSFIIIFMTFIFCTLLSTSLHLNAESNVFLNQSYEQTKQPDVLVAYMSNKYQKSDLKKLQNKNTIKSAYAETYYTGTFLSHGKSKEVIFFSPYSNQDFSNYSLPKLNGNNILISDSIKNTYNLKKDQNIVLKPGAKKETFHIQGFF